MRKHRPRTFAALSNLSKEITRLREHIPQGVERHLGFVLAVSGGIDSVLLLRLFKLVKTSLLGQLTVAHFDHRLRPDSEKDANFVEELAVSLGLPCERGVAQDSPGRENLESWARNRRYAFLESVRERVGADWIVTAHNQNDQVETLLMRAVNGRLATKSFGIAEVDPGRRLFRPFLSVSRAEIEECAMELGLRYREDPTNADLNRTRNKIRHTLIPVLMQEFNPRLLDSVSHLSSRLAHDEEYLWVESERIYNERLAVWDKEQFARLAPAVRWRVLSAYARLGSVQAPTSPQNQTFEDNGIPGEEVGDRPPCQDREVGYRALRLATELILENSGESFSMDLGACVRLNYSPKNGPKFEFYQHRPPSSTAVNASSK